MKEIILRNTGNVCLVDDCDFDFLNKWRWKETNNGYAGRTSYNKYNKSFGMLLMHRLINNTPHGLETDHINGIKLDNRKCNLRNVTRSENEYNKGIRSDNSSGFKGVCWDKNRCLWLARLGKIHIGRFKNIEDAKKARMFAERYMKSLKQ